MKKFIAFHGGQNSAIVTKEAAHKWASDLMNKGSVTKVHIAEVVETVERSSPPIEVKEFVPEPVTGPSLIAKLA